MKLEIKAKVDKEIPKMYSELRFEQPTADKKYAPVYRYIIDYCGQGLEGCPPVNNYLKYNRTFITPSKINPDVNIRLALIHHGLVKGNFTHVGCVNFVVNKKSH